MTRTIVHDQYRDVLCPPPIFFPHLWLVELLGVEPVDPKAQLYMVSVNLRLEVLGVGMPNCRVTYTQLF